MPKLSALCVERCWSRKKTIVLPRESIMALCTSWLSHICWLVVLALRYTDIVKRVEKKKPSKRIKLRHILPQTSSIKCNVLLSAVSKTGSQVYMFSCSLFLVHYLSNNSDFASIFKKLSKYFYLLL